MKDKVKVRYYIDTEINIPEPSPMDLEMYGSHDNWISKIALEISECFQFEGMTQTVSKAKCEYYEIQ